VDQEHGTPEQNDCNPLGEQPYSLRERVAYLESTVKEILRRLDQPSVSRAIPSTETPRGKDPEQDICSGKFHRDAAEPLPRTVSRFPARPREGK
jgi:hypothetical protein